MVQQTPLRQQQSSSGVSTGQRVNSQPSNVSVTTATPDQISSILLADGWHEIENAEFTHFAIGEGMSPPQPSKLYSALSYTDTKSGKQVVTSLRSILGYEFEETYQNNR